MAEAAIQLPASIEGLLARAAREQRLRRAEHGAWRGAFWGLTIAAVLLATRGWLLGPDDALALMLAAAVAVGGIALGALRGAARRVDRLEIARLADSALDLQDRIATSVEVTTRPSGGLLSTALVADTQGRLDALGGPHRVIPRAMPRESRWLALAVAATIVFALSPALPRPDRWIAEQLGHRVGASTPPDEPSILERARLFGAELASRERVANTDDAAKSAERDKSSAGEAATDYKDRSIRKEAMDFAAFAKKGDERLRMLERADKLPDLNSDFTGSKLRQLMRQSRELADGGQPGKISAGKLGQVLEEMQRIGRRNTAAGNEIQEAMDQLERGNTEQAYESMQSAMTRLREQEERQRDARRLRNGREAGPESQDGGRMDSAMASRDAAGGETAGSGRNAASKGKPTPRLRSTPYDAGIEGAQRGGQPAFESRSASRGSSDVQLQYMGELGQYRRQMEDAMSREQIPRGYHEQIRRYFNSLNEQGP